MKYYLIAGEASGDLHAANLMKAIKEQDSNAVFRFWGGDLMQEAGGKMVVHYKELAVMGFWEVLTNASKLFKYLKKCKKDIQDYQPDALILVDYSGFNLRIAPFAKKLGVKVHFYIAPKVWAWNESRVQKLKKYVDELYVIFPFEVEFFEKKHQLPVHYEGNPLIDQIITRKPLDEKTFRKEYQLSDKPIIALLPGSRSQEIKHMLPIMLEMLPLFQDYEFVIAGAPNRDEDFYQSFMQGQNIPIVFDKTYDLLSLSYAALVTSGTATLETALFKVPQVVCYKSSMASYQIAKYLVRNIEYISLVNLVLDQEVVKELIQNEFNKTKLELELKKILDPTYRKEIFSNYMELEKKLGNPGVSQRIAQKIVENT